MQVIDKQQPEFAQPKPVFNVTDFCKRYRLDQAEEKRLRKLFGDFASRHELLMNAQRKPDFR